MARRKHNVLLVVEGEKEEPRLVGSLFATFNPDADWEVYPYRTVVHDLIEKIESDYDGDYENIEICKVLADMRPDDPEALHILLDTIFTDVILLFDFDPQDDRFNPEAFRKMMRAYNDSGDTDRGLLLINYPSVESVKEAVALTYEEFVRSYVTVEDVSKYKSRVSGLAGSDAEVDHRNFSGYNIKAFTRAISHSVGKIQYHVKGMPLEETFPFTTKSDLSEQCRQISQVQLFDYQLRAYNVDGHITTCGTGPFFISLWAKSLDGAWKSCFGE